MRAKTSHTLAIDIGGTKFAVALFAGDRIIRRESHATDRSGGREWMLGQLLALALRWQREQGFARCGIGFGGPVDFPAQRVLLSTQVDTWQNCALPAIIEDALGVPTVMDNDANAGALGEALHGAGRGCDPLFYITLSTGIGGGLVFGRRVYRGADSCAGEIGHVAVRETGPRCLCGAEGCLERVCSGLWLERDFGRPPRELMTSPKFMGRYVTDLARGLKSVIMLLNPARIVIGGGLSKADAALLGPLDRELRRQITGWSHARIDLAVAALGDDSVLYGAMELARRQGRRPRESGGRLPPRGGPGHGVTPDAPPASPGPEQNDRAAAWAARFKSARLERAGRP